MNDNIPVKQIRADSCPICRTNRSIEIYNSFNSPIYFTKILDIDPNKLNETRYSLAYMKCKKCKSAFRLNWRYGDIPRPLIFEEDIKYIYEELMTTREENIRNEFNKIT